jgi:hypothetical protein
MGVQPQTFAVPPPPQVAGSAHEPQLSVAPHPSASMPQFLPCAAHVVGVHPHTFAGPAPPHVWGGVQEPHPSVAPHPSEIEPQLAP